MCHCGTSLYGLLDDLSKFRSCSILGCHSLICDKHENDDSNFCFDHLIKELKRKNLLCYAFKKTGRHVEYYMFTEFFEFDVDDIVSCNWSKEKNNDGLYELELNLTNRNLTLEISSRDNSCFDLAELWEKRISFMQTFKEFSCDFYAKSESPVKNLDDI